MTDSVRAFIERWKASGGAERANYQTFLNELCELLDVPKPDPAQTDEARNAYVFDRSIRVDDGEGKTSTLYIDLYRRGRFICETKQGIEQEEKRTLDGSAKRLKTGHGKRGTAAWTRVMRKAKGQAEQYARKIVSNSTDETGEVWPPFLMVIDIGHCIDLYAEFDQVGKDYRPFPNHAKNRILIEELSDPAVRERLRNIWLDPLSLDPDRQSAAVTLELAQRLAKLATSLKPGHDPQAIAEFLMRCLFTMFAEDVGLIPEESFTQMLHRLDAPENFAPMTEALWQTMNTGGFSPIIQKKLRQFNGGLFAECQALPLDREQLALMVEAAEADWQHVEPAIFGTLLEWALDPKVRHDIGAHFTPKTYVQRLVQPVVIKPMRQRWETVETFVNQLLTEADAEENDRKRQKKRGDAEKTLRDFLTELRELTILDPACGTGNFLYVAMQMLKEIEGEAQNLLLSLTGQRTFGDDISPLNFHGIELNEWASRIADLVLWIGYLKHHRETRGSFDAIGDPVIKQGELIEQRDAVLAWSAAEPLFDDEGRPVTRWDGLTYKPHPVTGEPVPDPQATVQALRYDNPTEADWPAADYIVGNPPFIGKHVMRESLGDGYTETIRKLYKNLPDGCDYVMYWWHRAAELVRRGKVRGFGFITTNSIRQTFNRRVIDYHQQQKKPLSLSFAIPDHPWVDSELGADVRISMTAGVAGTHEGELHRVISEGDQSIEAGEVEVEKDSGLIWPDLTIGPNVSATVALEAMRDVSNPGVKLHGSGFIIDRDTATKFGYFAPEQTDPIREYRNGRDLNQTPRGVLVIDLFGLTEEEARAKHPEIYQHVYENVKPERDTNRRATYRDNWWIHGEPRSEFRPALKGLPRFIATTETSKHRFFVFLDASILPDNKLVNIASDDAFVLGVLSSSQHVTWALATGATLEDRPVYPKSECFETFPFPKATKEQKGGIREVAEELDAHRKRQQERHPKLTMTAMYNVLERLREIERGEGEPLSDKERAINEQGLIDSHLKPLHDRLDQLVADAYGWPVDLPEIELLDRLVTLNAERAAEEQRGQVRWLRPEYQNPEGTDATQAELELETEAETVPVTIDKQKFPADPLDRIQAVRDVLRNAPSPHTSEQVARGYFTRARRTDVETALDQLVMMGFIRRTDDGRYTL